MTNSQDSRQENIRQVKDAEALYRAVRDHFGSLIVQDGNRNQKLPAWLVALLRIIVVRQDRRQFCQNIFQENPETAAASFLRLLIQGSGENPLADRTLDYHAVLNDCRDTCGFPVSFTESILKDFQNKGFVKIERKSEDDTRFSISDPEGLDLFIEYSNLKKQGRSFPEENIPYDEMEVMLHLSRVSADIGEESEEGKIVNLREFLRTTRRNDIENTEEVLTRLQKREIVSIFSTGENAESKILFREKTAARIQAIRMWLVRFRKEAVANDG